MNMGIFYLDILSYMDLYSGFPGKVQVQVTVFFSIRSFVNCIELTNKYTKFNLHLFISQSGQISKSEKKL